MKIIDDKRSIFGKINIKRLLPRLKNTDFPETIYTENTNACNADCIMCPREKMTRKIGFMDFELFKKVVDECAKYKNRKIRLHNFGESLLDGRIVEKIRYAKKKKLNIHLTTNASLLTPALTDEIINAGLDTIKISIGSVVPATYEAIHRGLKFNEVRSNIIYLARKTTFTKLRIILQHTQIGEKEEEEKLFIDTWSKYLSKKDKIHILHPHNFGYGRNYNPVRGNKSPCRFIISRKLIVLWDGTVNPCCCDFDGKIVFGDVKKQSLKEIWDSQPYRHFRKAHQTLDLREYPFCQNCDMNEVPFERRII